MKLFETARGGVGILTCYDSEFPLLGRALRAADVILVPAPCTEALSGYWRVPVGAMARALEGYCVAAMASVVRAAEWLGAVTVNVAMGGIYGPPDSGFPGAGVLAEGVLGRPGWTLAEIDLADIARVRADGQVLNRSHWMEQDDRVKSVTISHLQ